MSARQRKSALKDTGKEQKKDSNTSESNKKEKSASKSKNEDRYSPPAFWRRIIVRFLLSALMIFCVYWTSHRNKDEVFASQKHKVKHKTFEMECAPSYQQHISKFIGCIPNKCGRLVTDIIVTEEEASHLLRLAKKGLAFGGSTGGASILDLHSGAVSDGNAFVNVYEKIKKFGRDKIFTDVDFKVYSNVRNKIQQMIAFNFNLKPDKLYLTHPTFFSEMTAKHPKTVHDEYWHVHVDKDTYPSFHYTSLLYLSDYIHDFHGGRFFFVQKPLNVTVEPRLGRVSAFTSGAENPHFVERVTQGTRYALTVSFTCDKNFAIEDPSMDKL